jgi:hypothetical protein
MNTHMMRKTLTLLVTLLIVTPAGFLRAQSDIDQLIKDFTSSDWKVVKQAKMKLENYEALVIPKVLPLLDRDDIVKLTNTGSLIYPGATKFYGYGQMIEYDIDKIAIRAGWLLEDLTFNNFGFSGCHLAPEDQMNFIKITFPAYYNNATNRKTLESSSETELGNIIFKMSVKNAKEWWANEGIHWTRLQALVDALKSFDEKRQVKALFYMRNGETKCSGLTKEYYIDNIAKEIVRLSGSDTQRVSEHASNILSDTKFQWLENKNNP